MSYDQSANYPSVTSLDFAPATLRQRHNGWTADRQRDFIVALADNGCVSQACQVVGVSPQSAYRLRRHPGGQAFAKAWDAALRSASVRLVDIAMERAIHGSRRQLWRGGELVGETMQPSDGLLIFLLSRLDTSRFGSQLDRHEAWPDQAGNASRALPKLMDGLRDIDARADGPCDAAAQPLSLAGGGVPRA